MTPERWTDDMLDNFVGSLSNLIGLSEQNTRSISRQSTDIELLHTL